MLPPATARLMRQLNRHNVLTAVRRLGPVSRAEVAAETGLSQPAVTAIVRELMKLGLVQEVGIGQSSGGRPPIMLVFNPSAQFVLAASLEGDRVRAALADLSGAIFAEREGEARPGDPAGSLIHFLHDLIKEAREHPARLAAIGVGVPGITHRTQGTVSHAPALGWWQAVPLRDVLQQHFEVPVAVENDVNLMLLGEHFQGAGQGTSNLALMHVGDGIGAGIMIDGGLFRGPSDAAGEVGYLPLGPSTSRSPADFGLFERHYSVRGLQDRMLQAGFPAGAELADHPVATLRSLAHMQIPWAQALYEDALCQWSYALTAIVCILNPERVLLAGDAVECTEDGLEAVRSALASLVPVPPEVRFASLGSRAVLLGAITSALQVTFGDSIIRPQVSPAVPNRKGETYSHGNEESLVGSSPCDERPAHGVRRRGREQARGEQHTGACRAEAGGADPR